MNERFPSADDAVHYSALPLGAMLYEFHIESVLGHGGFGITYLARDTLLDKAVAIKEFFPNELAVRGSTNVSAKSKIDEQDFASGLESFLEEARTLARFSHPNIVTVRRFFKANGTGYIVQEYVSGQTLSRRINAAALDETELRKLLGGLLDGLELIHDSAILHRDIKPDNIILRDDGTPVLIDFGAARNYLGRHSRSITAIAAGGYTSPEQWGAGGQHGPWSDIYALGAVLYRCVTGASPPLSLQRLRSDPMVPAVVAGAGRYLPELLQLIDWMLKVDEADRPDSVAAVRAGLQGAMPHVARLAAEAAKEPSADAVGERQPRRRWLWPTVAAGVVLFVGTAGGFVLQQRSAYEARLATTAEDPPALEQFLANCSWLCPASVNSAAKARLDAVALARKKAEEATGAAMAKSEAEGKEKAQAEATARARAEAAAHAAQEERLIAQREAELRRRREEGQRLAAERQRAEEQERRGAEEMRRREAEAAQQRQAELESRQRPEATVRREANERAKREADEETQKIAEVAARQKADQELKAKEAERAAQQQKVASAQLNSAVVAEPVPRSVPAAQQQASLQPPATSPAETIRALQTELRRVGCYVGSVDGQWDVGIKRSLEQFNRFAGMQVETGSATDDAIGAVKIKSGRICPLVCEQGFRADGERCVRIACNSGFILNSDGSCVRRPPPKRPVAEAARPRTPSNGGTKCFTFNGSRYCE